jgi:hypothetical protein
LIVLEDGFFAVVEEDEGFFGFFAVLVDVVAAVVPEDADPLSVAGFTMRYTASAAAMSARGARKRAGLRWRICRQE